MTYFPVKTEIQGLLLEKASQPGGQRDGDYQALSHGANFLCVQPSRQQPQDGQSWAAASPESPSRRARLQGSAGADACVCPLHKTRSVREWFRSRQTMPLSPRCLLFLPLQPPGVCGAHTPSRSVAVGLMGPARSQRKEMLWESCRVSNHESLSQVPTANGNQPSSQTPN